MLSWHLYLILIIISLAVEGFFSMMEMALVSFSKVRMQYYAAQKSKRGQWLMKMISRPAILFGTTLLCVNAALQFGSECARRFYLSVGVSPDWAPLSQLILVLLFAELSPMFAARRYAEHVAILGAPILYAFSIILWPVTFLLNILCRFVNLITGIKTRPLQTLTREEIQKSFEEREGSELESVGDNIFRLRNQTAGDLCLPADRSIIISADATVKAVRESLHGSPFPFLPVYHITKANVIAVCYPRDLIRAQDNDRLRIRSRPAWFVPETMTAFELLKQFRVNNQSVAIVVNKSGEFSGVLCLDDLTREIFGNLPKEEQQKRLVQRTYNANTPLTDVLKKIPLETDLPTESTLEDLMVHLLGHRPITGEAVQCGPFELIMQDAGVIRGRRIQIRTK